MGQSQNIVWQSLNVVEHIEFRARQTIWRSEVRLRFGSFRISSRDLSLAPSCSWPSSTTYNCSWCRPVIGETIYRWMLHIYTVPSTGRKNLPFSKMTSTLSKSENMTGRWLFIQWHVPSTSRGKGTSSNYIPNACPHSSVQPISGGK